MRYTTLVVALLAGRSAWAGCDPAQLEPNLTAAEQAFAGGDPAAAVKAFSKVRRSLACADFAVSPKTCARIHRASAMTHWIEGDDAGTLLSLRAMRHADPMLDLPKLGPAHPMRQQLIEAEETTISWAPSGAKGPVLVDGLQTGVVPADQPYVLQPLADDGAPVGARLVERLTGSVADKQPVQPIAKTLRWTGLGLGVGGAALYGAAWGTNAAYQQAVIDRNDPAIGSLHTATNGLAVSSAALTGLALGAFVGAEATKH